MKKRFLTFAAIVSFFVAPHDARNEMKITPDGVSTPDNSGALHLSGSFQQSSVLPGYAGAVISGANTHADKTSTPSYGGYFTADDGYGKGVYGSATNTGAFANYGGYFQAGGKSARGVFGSATNEGDSGNYGGYFEASGQFGYGVYGIAKSEDNGSKYGGYFRANGDGGIGVHGRAGGHGGKGVWGYAYGESGKGVYGDAFGEKGVGVYGYASGMDDVVENYGGYFEARGTNGIGVHGEGTVYDFYAAGGKTNFGPFTGAHDVKFAGEMAEEIVPGMIVSLTGKSEMRKDEKGDISISSTLPTVMLSTKAMDKAVFGAVVSSRPLPDGHWYEAKEGERFGVVNALGEGRVWVTSLNGNIEAGDYITTSEIPGYGQKQDDDLLHSYTFGKAMETIDWNNVNASEIIWHEGKPYKAYLMAVIYTSG